MLPVCAGAQTTIGYTNGTFERNDGVRISSGTTQRVAMRIPAAKLAQLAGSKVTAIKSVFGTRNLDEVTFFIADDLNGTPLYEQKLSKFSTQWAEYSLNTPYTLTADRDLYFGYSITCNEAYKPLAFDRQKVEPGSMYGYSDAGWTDMANMGFGNLNLQLLVDGAPSFTDVSLRLFNADGYYKAGKEYSFTGDLFNFGNTPVSSFDVRYSVDGGEEQKYTVSGINVPSGSTYSFDIKGLESQDFGEKSVSVVIDNINGGADGYAEDNSRGLQMFFYPAGMERNVLVENFTGQTCGNCPMGHVALETAVDYSKNVEGLDNIVQVAYHSGYQPDDFTMMDDAYYQQFYKVNGAPTFMVNRYANPNVDASTPVFSLLTNTSATVANILDGIQQQAATQPYVGVYINTDYDKATRHLTGEVSVVTYRTPEVSNPTITLQLMQDSIVGNQASFTTGLGGSNYVHRHVSRGTINGTFGESITLEAGKVVSIPVDYTLPESILSNYDNVTYIDAVPENMYLVAVVGNHNTQNITDCVVLNCAAVKFGSSTITGITETPSAEKTVSARLVGKAGALRAEGDFDTLYIYNVDGKLVSRCTTAGTMLSLSPGVYVTRAVKDGAVSTAKIVVAR